MKIPRFRNQPAEQPAVIEKAAGHEMHDLAFALDFAGDAEQA